jgi:ABC-type sugar transport system, ATPase component
MNVLEAKTIRKSFGGVKALVNGEICCPRGKIAGLLGANGSGKTTFSKIITGLLAPDDGELYVNGKPVCFKTPFHAKQEGIVMVHQHLSLIPDLNVWENINIGHEPLVKTGFIDNKTCRKKAQEVINQLCPGLSLERKVASLSPAEQQLVEIAKSVSQQPQLLILDEPTSALEKTQVIRLFSILRELKGKGTSIIFISHRLGEVMEICDFIVVFRNGENVGTIDFAKDGKDERKIVSLITGKDQQNSVIRKSISNRQSQAMLEVKSLSYSDKLSNLNFNVLKGEIIGIGGLQNQGQEELLLVLSGLIHSNKGEIKIDDQAVRLRHPLDAIRNGIVLVPGDRQKEGLFLNHSIFMNIIYTRFGLKGSKWFIPFRKYRAEVQEIVAGLAVKTESIDTEIKNLSGGNQQKVVVGKWLPHNPKLLLLSDPAKGVDVQAKKELYDVVLALANKGTSVIIYASDNEELISYCERVFIMYEGHIVEEFKNDNINEEHIVAASLRTSLNSK